MTVTYYVRLILLCLAVFFVCHTVLAAAVMAMAGWARRRAAAMRAEHAALVLLCLRVFPGLASLLVAVGLCVPSYLVFEPIRGHERVGLACLVLAAAGGAVWLHTLTRAGNVLWRTWRNTSAWRRTGRVTESVAEATSFLAVPSAFPLFATIGLWRPRFVISSELLAILPEEELAAALRHERAHRDSADNWKRLLVLMMPGGPLLLGGLEPLESGWVRFAEQAADDRAVGGDQGNAVRLAAALVRVARAGLMPPTRGLVSSLISEQPELSIRVERLLNGTPAGDGRSGQGRWLTAWYLLPSMALALSVLHPDVARGVHWVLEELIG